MHKVNVRLAVFHSLVNGGISIDFFIRCQVSIAVDIIGLVGAKPHEAAPFRFEVHQTAACIAVEIPGAGGPEHLRLFLPIQNLLVDHMIALLLPQQLFIGSVAMHHVMEHFPCFFI